MLPTAGVRVNPATAEKSDMAKGIALGRKVLLLYLAGRKIKLAAGVKRLRLTHPCTQN